ncbi:sulfurtransferase [Paracraurococcus ruber]|uniref:3-mercaptopyruvate sulfurtransferase n=1 Tax=Paracraurococcus ruber TaxID=77675 RepID=A0ABS1CXV0_9PROT|nr:sulfurtransferase [Paracraurococcus ruber]MBK1659245.1 3-mercaptopyruvate sulfurtransferase [Paracraurococcus ruber]TDG31764.1 sulfurtransferase [Paracraurococcus ruber]
MDNLVSTGWLAAELGKPDLLVFDCSTYLPGEPGNKHDGFRAAHIPGAQLFDIDVIADTDSDLPHMVPTPARFAKLAGALGLSNASRVVFYDQHGLRASARGWWMLRLFGHDAVAVLDGGLPTWRREGRPVETGDAPPRAPASFVPDFRAERLRGIGDVKRIVRQGGGSELILDARAKGRFDGTAPEPRAGLPAGHMPGAANVPVSDLVGPDLAMKNPAELRAMFEAAGVTAERPVVTSCGSGVTACALALGLVRAGFPEPAVYDGSWTEWALRPETPKVHS